MSVQAVLLHVLLAVAVHRADEFGLGLMRSFGARSFRVCNHWQFLVSGLRAQSFRLGKYMEVVLVVFITRYASRLLSVILCIFLGFWAPNILPSKPTKVYAFPTGYSTA